MIDFTCKGFSNEIRNTFNSGCSDNTISTIRNIDSPYNCARCVRRSRPRHVFTDRTHGAIKVTAIDRWQYIGAIIFKYGRYLDSFFFKISQVFGHKHRRKSKPKWECAPYCVVSLHFGYAGYQSNAQYQ